MAIGSTVSGQIATSQSQLVIAGSAKALWTVANSDARTAQSSAMRYNPTSITDSTFRWVAVPDGATKVLVRGKVPVATTAVGTNPSFVIVGAYPTADNTDPATASADSFSYLRLDNRDVAATALQLDFPASPTTSNCLYNSVYFYSNARDIAGYDCLGASHIGIIVTTASSTTASAAVQMEVLFLN